MHILLNNCDWKTRLPQEVYQVVMSANTDNYGIITNKSNLEDFLCSLSFIVSS